MAEGEKEPKKMKRVPVAIFVAKCPHCNEQISIAFDRAAINAYQALLDKAEEEAKKLPPPGMAS
jgi:uncharacterized protein (UPF0212 family)